MFKAGHEFPLLYRVTNRPVRITFINPTLPTCPLHTLSHLGSPANLPHSPSLPHSLRISHFLISPALSNASRRCSSDPPDPSTHLPLTTRSNPTRPSLSSLTLSDLTHSRTLATTTTRRLTTAPKPLPLQVLYKRYFLF